MESIQMKSYKSENYTNEKSILMNSIQLKVYGKKYTNEKSILMNNISVEKSIQIKII